MLKVYLAHPIDTTGELNDSIRVAQEIESITKYKYLGTACDLKLETETGEEIEIKESDAFMEVPKFEVYTPAFNDNINNRENLPSSELIYAQEIERMLSSDIVVTNYTGDTNEVLFILGYLAGWETSSIDYDQPPTVYVYSSNKQITQSYHNKLNNLVLTAIDMDFIWCDTEEIMLQKLKEL